MSCINNMNISQSDICKTQSQATSIDQTLLAECRHHLKKTSNRIQRMNLQDMHSTFFFQLLGRPCWNNTSHVVSSNTSVTLHIHLKCMLRAPDLDKPEPRGNGYVAKAGQRTTSPSKSSSQV